MDTRTRGFLVAGLVAAVLVAVVVSQFASGEPDGLEYVAEQEGFMETAEDHLLAEFALADYGGNLDTGDTASTAIAGAAGVAITLLVGYGVFWIARRTGSRGATGR